MTRSIQVEIPETLYRELEKRLPDNAFSSVQDLVAYILQDFLDRQTSEKSDPKGIDDEAIRNRLKNLGYL